MRLSAVATVCMMLGLALVLPACGEERAVSAEEGATTAAEGGGAKAAAAAPPCRSQLRGFLGSLDALREKLATGLDYQSYLREVRGVRVIYAAIEAGRMAVGCLLASGAPAERAFNQYIDAANAWGECLTTATCETGSLEPELQRRWARASDLVSEAQRGLREAQRY